MPATTPSQTVGPYFTLGLFASQADELVEPTSSGAVRVTSILKVSRVRLYA